MKIVNVEKNKEFLPKIRFMRNLAHSSNVLRLTASLLLGSALLTSPTLVHAASVNGCADGDCWTSPGGNEPGSPDQYGYETGKRFYPADVKVGGNLTLIPEYTYPVPIDTTVEGSTISSNQGSPLVIKIDGKTIMFVVTPFPNKIIALDLTSAGSGGALPPVLWTQSPGPSSSAPGLTCCDSVNRGAAYGETTDNSGTPIGVVVYTLLDGQVVAYNARTGVLVWRSGTNITGVDIWKGETLNTAPTIVKGRNADGTLNGIDKVIFGSSGSEMGINGSVRALNLKDGSFLWQAYSVGSDSQVKFTANTNDARGGKDIGYEKDRGNGQGQNTWPNSMQNNGGGSVWTWVTYDPTSHTIFYGTSQPGTFNPDMRQGDNKWATAIFARDPETGEAKWVYQTVPHDNWDYDAMNENTVIDLVPGTTDPSKKAIVHLHKNGHAYVMNIATGKFVLATGNSQGQKDTVAQFGVENWSGGGIDTTTGYPKGYNTGTHNYDASVQTHTLTVSSGICPSPFGVKNWGYSSYSKTTGYSYFGAFNACQNYRPAKVNYIAGTPFVGAEIGLAPNFGGTLYTGAKNTANGSTISSDPISGSNFVQSIGSQDGFMMGEFVAFDPISGERKWTIREPKVVVGGALSTQDNVVFYGTADGRFRAVNGLTGALLDEENLGCGVVSAPIAFRGGDGNPRVAITTGLGWLNAAFANGGTKCAGKVHIFKFQ